MFWQSINSELPKEKYFSLIVRVVPCLSIHVLRVWRTVTRGRCHISTLARVLAGSTSSPEKKIKHGSLCTGNTGGTDFARSNCLIAGYLQLFGNTSQATWGKKARKIRRSKELRKLRQKWRKNYQIDPNEKR